MPKSEFLLNGKFALQTIHSWHLIRLYTEVLGMVGARWLFLAASLLSLKGLLCMSAGQQVCASRPCQWLHLQKGRQRSSKVYLHSNMNPWSSRREKLLNFFLTSFICNQTCLMVFWDLWRRRSISVSVGGSNELFLATVPDYAWMATLTSGISIPFFGVACHSFSLQNEPIS